MNFTFFSNWNNIKKNNNNKKIILNFGPQHPAAHGVLRLILQLSDEKIEKLDTHIGLLHRGTENLITKKHFEKSIPYFDRLDYVSMMTQEHAYCLTIESLLNTKVLKYNSYIRILFDELTRILNHMLAISCHALDVGSMSSLFWCFEERENIMQFYEFVSGARMHAAFHKISNNFDFELSKTLIKNIIKYIPKCYKTLNEMHNVLTYNKIWKNRLINIGNLNINNVANFSLTGVMARCVGFKKDLRLSKINNYSNYNDIRFKSYIGLNGDSYDRFLIRMLEMSESLKIINLVIYKLRNIRNKYNKWKKQINKKLKNNYTSFYIEKKKNYNYMEDTIDNFLNWHTGFIVKKNIKNKFIESPKGEFGCIIISNNSNKPFKCKIRSPSYFNLQFLPSLSKGHYLSDLAALIGTIDVVFGEIDR